jgi:hypothetical protein
MDSGKNYKGSLAGKSCVWANRFCPAGKPSHSIYSEFAFRWSAEPSKPVSTIKRE